MWIAIGLGVVAFLAFMFLMFVVVPKKLMVSIVAAAERRVAATVPADQIVRQDLQALSFGRESRGKLQSRGNGALVLTSTHLHWLQLVPQTNDVTIPIASITAVGTKRAHLGKSYGRPLLHVTFTSDGATDSVAWFSLDVPGWIAALEAARLAAS